MVGPKKQGFLNWLMNHPSKEIQMILFELPYTLCQKVPKLYIQSQFSLSKRRPVFVIFFFLNSIFEPLYFLKLCLIFDELTFLVGIF